MTESPLFVSPQDMSTEKLMSIYDYAFVHTPSFYHGRGDNNSIESWNQAYRTFLQSIFKAEYKPYAICVNAKDVNITKQFLITHDLTDIKMVATVGFPHHLYPAELRNAETSIAIRHGAQEIDMVLNHALCKQNGWHNAMDELMPAIEYAKSRDIIVKLIVEVSEFSLDELKTVCEHVQNLCIDFIKTSTGYSSSGASVDALKVIKAHYKGGIKISGGVNINNVISLLETVSSKTNQLYLDPMHIRIGASHLITL